MNLNKIMKNIFLGLLTFICIVALPIESQAATFSISGPSSVDAKETFTVTFGSGTTGQYSYSVSGGTLVDSPSWVEGGGTLTIKAGSSGSVVVKITATNVTTSDYEDIDPGTSKTKTITIKEATSSSTDSSTDTSTDTTTTTTTTPTVSLSSDNLLTSLAIDEVELSPEFSTYEYEYTTDVWDLETITITASKSHSAATISGTGTYELSHGANTFEIIVTAENGSTRTYTITVNLFLSPTVFMEYNDITLGVVKNLDDVEGFSCFDKCILEHDGEEIDGWYSTLLDIYILYMVDDDDNFGFYIYQDAAIISEFHTITIQDITYYVFNSSSEEDRDGFVYEEITIDGITLMGWGFEAEAFANYKIIQLTNEDGVPGEYLYSIDENIVMLSPDFAPVAYEDYTSLISELSASSVSNQQLIEEKETLESNLQTFMMISGILLFVLLLILAYLIYRLIKSKKLTVQDNELEIYNSGDFNDIEALNEDLEITNSDEFEDDIDLTDSNEFGDDIDLTDSDEFESIMISADSGEFESDMNLADSNELEHDMNSADSNESKHDTEMIDLDEFEDFDEDLDEDF